MFERKIWKNRISEYPTRRKLVKEDGSEEIVTVERCEGSVSQEGDAFSQDNMNNLEQRIEDAIGVTDISGIGDGTVTGVIAALYEALGGVKHVVCTQDEYDALAVKEPDVLYVTYIPEE